MSEEIQKVHLDLEGKNSILDNKLILVWASPYGAQRDKTYRVRHFEHQYNAILELAKQLANENSDFLDRLVEIDRKKFESIPNRKRWVAEDRSILPGHKIHEMEGFYLELKHDRIQQGNFAKVLCEAADVEFSPERRLRI